MNITEPQVRCLSSTDTIDMFLKKTLKALEVSRKTALRLKEGRQRCECLSIVNQTRQISFADAL